MLSRSSSYNFLFRVRRIIDVVLSSSSESSCQGNIQLKKITNILFFSISYVYIFVWEGFEKIYQSRRMETRDHDGSAAVKRGTVGPAGWSRGTMTVPQLQNTGP